MSDPVTRGFVRVLDDVRQLACEGNVADYIPELATADPEGFAISAVSVSGHSYAAGDATTRFTIQSISKPFVYALALAEHGVDEVTRHVGVEPSGEAFNAISFDAQGRPSNPMINAGALVTTSLIPACDGEERYQRIRQGLSAFAGRDLELAEAVYRSESETGDRNRALATLARSFGTLGSTVDAAAEPYFKQCSLLVDSTDLAMMGATLANDGVNPLTGCQVVSSDIARAALSLMASCGMYDRSGQWLLEVGMPAKSGVGGGIVAVAPGEYGIGVFSPPLDPAGNSSRGVAVLRALSQEFGLHLFRHPERPASPISSLETDESGGTLTVRLRGVLDFVAVEQVAHEVAAAVGSSAEQTLVIDLADVTGVTQVAARLMHDLLATTRVAGGKVDMIDPSGVLMPQ